MRGAIRLHALDWWYSIWYSYLMLLDVAGIRYAFVRATQRAFGQSVLSHAEFYGLSRLSRMSTCKSFVSSPFQSSLALPCVTKSWSWNAVNPM